MAERSTSARLMRVLLVIALFLGICNADHHVTAVYKATLMELSNSGVMGSVVIFVDGSRLLGIGHAMGLEADLDESTNCTATNGCGVHVHAGTACTDAASQMGHYWANSAVTDPWLTVRYPMTNSSGFTSFTFDVSDGDVATTYISGRVFIIHDNAGGRVACGTLTPVSMSATSAHAHLRPYGGSGVKGLAFAVEENGMVMGVGEVVGAEANLMANHCMGDDRCAAALYTGSNCADNTGSPMMESGMNPWSMVKYSPTDATGMSHFLYMVEYSSAAMIMQKPFVVTNSTMHVVSCGTFMATTPTLVPGHEFHATLTELGNSGVSGRVAIYITETGMVGAGFAMGLESDLWEESNCTATNACGVHVHAGTACTDASTQMGHFWEGAVDPWLTVRYPWTTSQGETHFNFFVLDPATDINGKVFIIHRSDGGRVACGKIMPMPGGVMAYDATLAQESGSGVTGTARVHVDGDVVFGAVSMTGLMASSQPGSVKVFNTTTCGSMAGMTPALVPNTTWDVFQWMGTDAVGSTASAFMVKATEGPPMIDGLAVAAMQATGSTAATCGLLDMTTTTTTTTSTTTTMTTTMTTMSTTMTGTTMTGTTMTTTMLGSMYWYEFVGEPYHVMIEEVGSSGVTGRGTLITTARPGIVGGGFLNGLETTGSCSGAGACGVTINEGTCANIGAVFNPGSGANPWMDVKYDTTVTTAMRHFRFSPVMNGQIAANDLMNKLLVVHNTAGDVVACGIILAPPSSLSQETASLSVVGETTDVGQVRVYANGMYVFGVATFRAMTPNNAGGNVGVYGGTSCESAESIGTPFSSNVNPNPWTASTSTSSFATTDGSGRNVVAFMVQVTTSGTARIGNKLFAIEESGGAKMLCGRLTNNNNDESGTVGANRMARTPGMCLVALLMGLATFALQMR